ncbi:MAG: ECF RNA polymerase sigma factor SigW [Planctomycetes bacterium]|nr:ECF RNA polymerase sigma factor SigW [Planctomycetota bacterium]
MPGTSRASLSVMTTHVPTDLRDPDTLRKAYEAHSKALYNLAYRLVGDRQWAEDLLQETFVRAYTRADTFREGGQVSTWLYRICMNLCYDHLRAQKYRQAASLDAPAPAAASADGSTTAFGATLPSNEKETAAVAEDRDATSTVRRLIDELPERERSVVLLRQYHDMTFDEIGEVLGLTARTAQNCLRRAREKLYFGLKQQGLAPAV